MGTADRGPREPRRSSRKRPPGWKSKSKGSGEDPAASVHPRGCRRSEPSQAPFQLRRRWLRLLRPSPPGPGRSPARGPAGFADTGLLAEESPWTSSRQRPPALSPWASPPRHTPPPHPHTHPPPHLGPWNHKDYPHHPHPRNQAGALALLGPASCVSPPGPERHTLGLQHKRARGWSVYAGLPEQGSEKGLRSTRWGGTCWLPGCGRLWCPASDGQ